VRRREALRERAQQEGPVAPISVQWAEPAVRAKAGHCPRCGKHVGRAVRAHTRYCDGTVAQDETASA